MRTTVANSPLSTADTITRWKTPTPIAVPGTENAFADAHPAGDVDLSVLGDAVGGNPMPTTTWACLTLASYALSCGPCDSTLWKGSCNASTFGCCPAPV